MIKRLLIIQSIVIILLVFLLTIYAKDEFHDYNQGQDQLENESFVMSGNRLSLSEKTQNLIGLKVQKVNSKLFHFLQPLIQLIQVVWRMLFFLL